MKLLLKAYDVSEEVFEQILIKYESLIKIESDITQYRWGYKNKNIIYYNNNDELIIKEMYLDLIFDLGTNITDWKQCIVRKCINQSAKVEKSITGTTATAYINEILRKYYTDSEIEDLLNAHTADYDIGNKQYHYLYPLDMNTILKFNNCIGYDINGAHLDALSDIFPKAKKDFTWLFNNRKKSPKYKKIPNFYVGNLCNNNHRPTYNWIVQRTNQLLQDALSLVGGTLLYANTDGFIVSRPSNKLDISKELGKFKLEANGDVYLYQGNNYFVMQYEKLGEGNIIKGNALISVRDKIDLANGKIVKYDRIKEGLVYKPINIKEIKLQWQKA